MATSNRSVKAVLLPRPPIRTKEAGKLRISRNTNTDSFIGDHEIPADSAVYDDAEGKATVEVEVTVIDARSGDRQIAEEEEHGLGKKRGAKKGKRAPYLEAMQRNLHLFMPLTSEGVYLLVSASFPYLSAKATTNDEELIAWFNEARELLYLHTTLDVGGQIGWTRQLFMDRLNKLHVLNKKPATARPEVKELQDCFAEREKTTLMRTVEASRHEIQLRSMKGPKEVIGRNSGLSSEEEANTCYQISDWSATNAAGGDRDNCRMPTPRFTQEALKVAPAGKGKGKRGAAAEEPEESETARARGRKQAPVGKGKDKRGAAGEEPEESEIARARGRKQVKRLGKAMVEKEPAGAGSNEDLEETSSSEIEDEDV
ncbi:g10698 [Coccomyxa elongata]